MSRVQHPLLYDDYSKEARAERRAQRMSEQEIRERRLAR